MRDAAKADIRYVGLVPLFFVAADSSYDLWEVYSPFTLSLSTSYHLTSHRLLAFLGLVLHKCLDHCSNMASSTGVWLAEVGSSGFQARYMKMLGRQW